MTEAPQAIQPPTKRRRLMVIIVAAVVVLLVALLIALYLAAPKGSPGASGSGSPAATTSPSPTPSQSPSPSTSPAAEPVPADAFVVITAVATDASGAQLELRMVVHQPISKSDPAAASDLAAFAAACAPEHDWATIEPDPDSGMERIDITARQRGAIAWPSTAEIEVFPLSDGFHPKLATGTGIDYGVAVHNEVPQPTHCFDVFSLFGEANGTLSMYMFPRPYLGQPLPSPNRFLWNITQYGFESVDEARGVTFSDCTISLTPAAQAFGLTDDVWLEYNQSSACAGGDFRY